MRLLNETFYYLGRWRKYLNFVGTKPFASVASQRTSMVDERLDFILISTIERSPFENDQF